MMEDEEHVFKRIKPAEDKRRVVEERGPDEILCVSFANVSANVS